MPRPEILKALGMTPAEWGDLSPDERDDYTRQAEVIIERTRPRTVLERLEKLEAEVERLASLHRERAPEAEAETEAETEADEKPVRRPRKK